MRLDLIAALNTERAARRAAVVVTELVSGAQRLVRERDFGTDVLAAILQSQIRSGKSGIVEAEGCRYFLELHLPPPRMVITGAVHVSQALAPMAKMLAYDVAIVDPRTAFATPERFPDIRLLAEWPDQALPKIGLDHWTAFVALTHDPKIDEAAIEAALKAGCFYVGALGSKKTHARRVEHLRARGLGDDLIARIHAPIGVSIGAASPAEIAVAILAEITLRLRRGAEAKP
ncbi:MAG TPA: XdhC family protein [Xanthobacteraceae bacterium]|nr:XdhC family protein [Xanthobacteraceae bacterium]